MTDSPTASDIRAALKLRYPPSEYALMWEVANGVGAARPRYADALAMSLYPSRGLELHGFEIKVSRHDWTREKRNPEKADSFVRYCDRWWIVAPREVVPHDQLPPTWGLIEFDGKTLRQAVKAPKLPAQELTRDFIAAVLRRGTAVDEGMIGSLVRMRIEELRAADEQRIEHEVNRRTAELTSQVERIRKIEEAAGISLTDWSAGPEIGRAIKLVQALGVADTYALGRRLARDAESYAEKLTEHIAEFDKVAPPPTEDQAEEARLRDVAARRRSRKN